MYNELLVLVLIKYGWEGGYYFICLKNLSAQEWEKGNLLTGDSLIELTSKVWST